MFHNLESDDEVGLFTAEPVDRRLAVLDPEIRYLRDRVLASRARLVVVAVPPRDAIYPADAEADRLVAETMERGLNTVCRAENIPFFSGTRRIRELADQSRERLYFTRDWHMTRAGNEAMAIAVSEFLRNSHLLDAAGP